MAQTERIHRRSLLGRGTDQLGAFAANVAEVLVHGGFETGDESSPYDVVAQTPMYRLRRYYADFGSGRPVVVLVPPMMFVADVYDVSPTSSAVTVLHENGIDPWVVDFGAPEHEAGGLQRTLADHILAVSEIVDRVRAETGRDVHLGGYSQGGVFSYAVAAYRRGDGLASVVSFGSPVDTRSVGIFSLPEPVMEFAADQVGTLLAGSGLPGWATREGFKMLAPVKNVRSRVKFVLNLHDREALLPFERQRRFIGSEGWIAWPAPALADALHQIIAQNRILSGGLVIDGRTVTLADVERPVLCFVGEQDQIGQPQAVRAIGRAAPRADIHEVSLPVGHLGIVVGSAATAGTWPAVASWASHHDNGSGLAASIRPLDREPGTTATNPVLAAAGEGLRIGRRFGAAVLGASRSAASGMAGSIPRLAGFEHVRPDTRVSLGRLLDARAAAKPEDIGFLWADRAYSHAELKGRVDAVVAGLASVGIRQGDPVGLLMDTRPSMLVTVAALNRLGAVAVLVRPDGDVTKEIEISGITRIVADPEHADLVRGRPGVDALVLGGGGELRDLGDGLIDLERVVPAQVEMPVWYRPNPGLAQDVAFVLFNGTGPSTRVRTITNARWASAAQGAAALGGLTPRDTVYSVHPIHHPAGLLMSLGGAAASGARFAMASRFDPDTFWEESRRYGVTAVSYTWTSLRELVQAPPHPGEQHHLIRTFLGTGMPADLWQQVEERFSPTRVVEYYAPALTDAILINPGGRKPGCQGAPMPGGPELRVARTDGSAVTPRFGKAGYAEACATDEVGMLLSRVEQGFPATDGVLRGLFAPGDAWVATGDLCYVDGDGDFWFLSDRILDPTTNRPLH